jgi:DNA recombination protein RmuC
MLALFAVSALLAGLLIGLLLRGALAKTERNEFERRISELSGALNSAGTALTRSQEESAARAGFESLAREREERVVQLTADCNQLRADLNAKSGALKDAEAASQRASDLVASERDALGRILAAKDEQIVKLNEFIGQAREVLSTEFKALSADALRDASAQLVKTTDGLIGKHGELTTAGVKLHQEHIESLLKPVEETIKRLDKHVEDSDLARAKADALLDEQVRRLAGASESLTNALRKPVVRGSWGESTLENALESAGLEPEIDFVLQHYTDAEDGQKRTDAVVNLPKGRKLIIDSKNLMESYLALANAEDEVQRVALAEVHSKSLKRHIKALSAKGYWRRYEGLDCVILFIPHDGMYHAAIQDESELIREACDKRVFVSNPMTLIPLLKAVRYVLDQERLNRNAEEIKTVGAELYTELTRFAANISAVGEKLRATVQAYNGAIPGLDRFIISKSRKLKQLGTAKGADAELPEPVDLEPRLFSSRELRGANQSPEAGDLDSSGLEPPGLALAAESAENSEAD